MPLEYISEALVNELKSLEPFGQGNEKPQFAQKNLRIRSLRALGRNNNAVRMTVITEQGRPMEAMVLPRQTSLWKKQRTAGAWM